MSAPIDALGPSIDVDALRAKYRAERDKRLRCKVWRPAGRGGGGRLVELTVAPAVREERKPRRVLFR